ncbi:MAG: hypothetical protein GX878_00570 [Firmicutes bacterium]|nr:hypothetical protein [Bacillota bacterium]
MENSAQMIRELQNRCALQEHQIAELGCHIGKARAEKNPPRDEAGGI